MLAASNSGSIPDIPVCHSTDVTTQCETKGSLFCNDAQAPVLIKFPKNKCVMHETAGVSRNACGLISSDANPNILIWRKGFLAAVKAYFLSQRTRSSLHVKTVDLRLRTATFPMYTAEVLISGCHVVPLAESQR